MRRSTIVLALGLALGASWHAFAQDVRPPGFKLPPMPAVTGRTPAKELFGRVTRPSAGREQSIGFYSKGCLSGGDALPLSGPTWQVMRPGRDRFYGRMTLINFIQRLSKRVASNTAWPGLLIGDMSQPRGGPMLGGHASHQIGLDVDIWLRPMPAADLTRAQRETLMSTNVVAASRADVNSYWSADHVQVIKDAAIDSQVERVLVNPAIKKALCRDARGDRGWLQKVRPNWGHDYHMHIRLGCPAGESICKPQADVVAGEGCGKALDWWFTPGRLFPTPPKNPPKPRPPMTLAEMPAACADVLQGP